MQPDHKTNLLQIRISDTGKRIIELAASGTGRSLSEFMRSAALREAYRVLVAPDMKQEKQEPVES